MARVSLNVSTSSSSEGLKEDLTREARRRGFTLSRLVRDVLVFALQNKAAFEAPIEDPRDRPGKHISTTVTDDVRDEFTQWANARGTPRTDLIAFVLEKALEDRIVDRIYAPDDQDEDED